MSSIDQAFFLLETAQRPMNVGVLTIVAPRPVKRGKPSDALVQRMLRRPVGPPFDCRLAPPHSAADARRIAAAHLPNAAVEIVSERLKPFETDESHPLVQTALRCARRERARGSLTLSDMALLQGIPAVKCGPGETARSHTPDE